MNEHIGSRPEHESCNGCIGISFINMMTNKRWIILKNFHTRQSTLLICGFQPDWSNFKLTDKEISTILNKIYLVHTIILWTMEVEQSKRNALSVEHHLQTCDTKLDNSLLEVLCGSIVILCDKNLESGMVLENNNIFFDIVK